MPLQFQNYGAAFANAPAQREARDRSASILNVGEQISKLQESNALKKKEKKERRYFLMEIKNELLPFNPI